MITADFRLVTASNKALKALVDAGEFRQDLYYRINILELELPALHQRPGDVMPIVQHLLAQQGKTLIFTPEAQAFLNRYPWPGNIRELQAMVYRLIVLLQTDVVNKEILQQLCQLTPASQEENVHNSDCEAATAETDLLKKQEKQLIARVLETTAGDRTKAAVMLGISPTTLWRKLKEHRIGG